jgi:hypothetical protein
MGQLNRYYRRSKISGRKFRQLVRHFALDLTASKTTQFTGLTRKTVTTILLKIRARIAAACERASPFSACEVEVDESYFGARRVRGKRGRGASGKTIVFGLLKRERLVSTPRSCRTAKRSHYKPSSAGGSHPKRSSTRTAGAATTDWLMSATPSTSESITGRTSSLAATVTSTASRASGALPNAGSRSSTASLRTLSICI